MTAAGFARTNLLHQPGRTAISVVGAAFAVVLVFMQLGFLGSVENTATLLYGKLRFDLLITSSEYIDLARPGKIERDRLAMAHASPGIKEVLPFSIGPAQWLNPTDDPAKGRRKWQITVVGVDPGNLDRTFLPPGQGGIFATAEEQAEKKIALARLDEVFLDERSRPDFGAKKDMTPGITQTEVNGRLMTLAGYFRAGTGFSYTGLLLTNEQNFRETIGSQSHNATFGLVQLEDGIDPESAKAALKERLPGDVRIFTRAEIEEYERNYWVNRTAVGQFFYFGVLLAIAVGGIFIYQMMVADIKKHLPEYATLKAMGYRFGFLFSIVVWQSLYLAIVGYALGLIAAFGFYEVTKVAASLPIGMTLERTAIVFGLTVGMCVISGILAVKKVRTADPADLF